MALPALRGVLLHNFRLPVQLLRAHKSSNSHPAGRPKQVVRRHPVPKDPEILCRLNPERMRPLHNERGNRSLCQPERNLSTIDRYLSPLLSKFSSSSAKENANWKRSENANEREKGNVQNSLSKKPSVHSLFLQSR